MKYAYKTNSKRISSTPLFSNLCSGDKNVINRMHCTLTIKIICIYTYKKKSTCVWLYQCTQTREYSKYWWIYRLRICAQFAHTEKVIFLCSVVHERNALSNEMFFNYLVFLFQTTFKHCFFFFIESSLLLV